MKDKVLIVLLLVLNIANGQNSDRAYQYLWKKVYKDEINLLPKSALEKVKTICKKANKDKNEEQKIKCLIYQSKFVLTLEENAQLKVINNFKIAIDETQDRVSKALLNSLLAQMYWEYYKTNRWKIQSRTKTNKKENSKDFRTWSLDRLFHQINIHFQKSLEDKILLQKTKKEHCKELIDIDENLTEYRPTLYDFLAHNALLFYKNSQSGLTEPKEPFLIDNKNYLIDIETIKLETKNVFSTKYQALKIYQSLIQFHKKEKYNHAYFKILFETIRYIEQNGTFMYKKQVKLSFLENLRKQYPLVKNTTLLYFEIAKTYFELGNLYSQIKKHQFKYVKSIELCNQILVDFSDSSIANACKKLKSKITETSLSCEIEAYVPIQSFSKIRIGYKNVKEATFSIIKLNKKSQAIFAKTTKESEKQKIIDHLSSVYKWKISLPDTKDYQQHTTEAVLPKLKQGAYVFVGNVLGNKPYFKEFQVTNLTLLSKPKGVYQVLDRNNGQPIDNAKVNFIQIKKHHKDKSLNKYFSTSLNGEFNYTSKNYYYHVNAKVSTPKDTLFLNNLNISNSARNRKYKNIDEITIAPFVFTDRSIYRPGQTVYFKAIFIKKQGERTELFTNEYVELIIEDVNGTKVKEFHLKLNEYGTVSGDFQLPKIGLTGKYSFKFDKSSKHKSKFYEDKNFDFLGRTHRISVEEYKRPKFETSFDVVKENFKINDTIKVHGTATAMAGSKITDAKVVYRVVRKARYPRWCWWVPSVYKSQEIEEGETKTNGEGKYTITFKAIPDASIAVKNQPTFYYTVYADVTDLNGETRSTETEVAVGYHALNLIIGGKEKLNIADKKNEIIVESENLNGQFVPVVGVLKIYKLLAPQYPQRKNTWQKPDQPMISESGYKDKFPYENFENISNPEKWEKGALVYQKKFDTEKSKNLRLGNIKKWKTGSYIILATTKDTFGQEVKDEKIIYVFDKKAKKVADQQLFDLFVDKKFYQPNDIATISIGSASKNMTVFVEIEKNHQIVSTHQIHLNNEIKTIKIPVSEQDRGGFAVKWHWVNLNSIDNGVSYVSVPYLPTDLNIETQTFRNVLEPGAKQTWRFKIKGTQQDKVAAEVLASMYDASLDQFKPHSWKFNPIPKTRYSTYYSVNDNGSFKTQHFQLTPYSNTYYYYNHNLGIEKFNWFGFSMNNNRWVNRQYLNILHNSLKGKYKVMPTAPPPPPSPERFMRAEDNIVSKSRMNRSISTSMMLDKVMIEATEAEVDDVVNFESINKYEKKEPSKKLDQALNSVKARTNFNETAFFFPQLKTDKKGAISFEFTMPEDVTKWKLQLLAHNKQLNTATKTLTTVTQKELMVIPNVPRFLREGDEISVSTKIVNLEENVQQGRVKLELTDPITGKNIDELLQNNQASQSFKIVKKGNTSVSWSLQIPENLSAVQYKIVAATNNFSDGEQNVLPVLSNRMLVTESLPLWVNGNQTKIVTLDRLKNNTSKSLKHHQLTLEITSNPAWYAVQALPYLMEYPHECAEQTFARYYANQLASHVVNSNPKIKKVFHQWASSDALVSSLEKNQELKSIIIEETPWLRDTQSETEQKRRIALLFDLSKMETNLNQIIKKLEAIQFASGGFPWFKGSRHPSRNITQYIVQGVAHLKQLGVTIDSKKIDKMVEKAQSYLDDEIVDDYESLLEQAAKIKDKATSEKKGALLAKEYLAKKHVYSTQLHYLYLLSFDKKRVVKGALAKAIAYYTTQSIQFWKEESLYNKALLALIYFRDNKKVLSASILKSLKENSITNDETGMYWKENKASWHWYQSPVETQSLLIEAFSEIENEQKTIDHLKKWLLKNKQTQQWKTTKATSEAIYALLLKGSEWLAIDDDVEVSVGGKKLGIDKVENVEAGTGYFKTRWKADKIRPAMATVSLTKKEKGIAWGALYWQYFEDLDKIKRADTPLRVKKEVLVKRNTNTGAELQELKTKTPLKLGDLLTVRIEISTDRDMEFVHMKDMRASGLEPVEVLSGYQWKYNLGYYQSTKDAATHFFFDKIRKGIYVFEYDLRVSHQGMFSNGITTLQSMYAPEFSSHSKGINIEVK